MMNIRLSMMLLFALTFGIRQFVIAQDYLDEVNSGYSGGINKIITLVDDALSFIVMGDWGRMGGFHQQSVADQMAISSITADVEFIISVGDNFYPNGVQSTQDHQWISSFEEIYNTVNLHRDWIVALGNHDYHGSIQAQIDYTDISRRWFMPAPYYDRYYTLEDGSKLHLIVMDTNPFINKYHLEYDEYPDLSAQDTTKQIKWLEEKLATNDSLIKWKIVVGHHPMYSGAKRKTASETLEFEKRFAQLFDRYNVDAYLCGHEHDLQIVQPQGRKTVQFLSGAASEVRPSGNTNGTIFAAAEPGFMLFSLLPNQLLVQTIKADGTILHQYKIDKK